MSEVIAQFHFIRPMWLLALLPVIIIVAGLILKNSRQNQWTSVIDQHLLQHLLIGQKKIQQPTISPLLILTISLLLAVIALAGPTWQQRALPVFETAISKVILLDLSLSMESTDIKPSRLVRAKYKINDLLKRTNEGQVALIVYAGDAFVISPLTTDSNTILTMIPPLAPSLMPILGSEPHTAFKLADELFTNAGVFSGQIIWITDGIDDRDYALVAKQLKNSRHQISILAVGTLEGAPIPLPDGRGFLKDDQGSIVLPTLKLAPLKQLADLSNGSLNQLTADDRDIEQILLSLKQPEEFISSDKDLQMDTWVEFGPWLLLPIILVTALAFRKGIIVVLLFTLMPIFPSTSNAAEKNESDSNVASSTLLNFWDNLWQTPDQQAALAFKKNELTKAADLFEQKDWKSAAMYKAGQYNAALELFSENETATANFNKGNTLAQLGRLEEAIAAYASALEREPDMEDALYNKALVEELLKKQQEQQQQNEQNKDQQQNGQQQKGEDQDSEQQEQEQEQEEQQQEPEQSENKDELQTEEQNQQQESELEQMNEAEREQALEQWLRMIKDDPGGLLRRKMYMEYQRRQQQEKKLQDKGEKVW